MIKKNIIKIIILIILLFNVNLVATSLLPQSEGINIPVFTMLEGTYSFAMGGNLSTLSSPAVFYSNPAALGWIKQQSIDFEYLLRPLLFKDHGLMTSYVNPLKRYGVVGVGFKYFGTFVKNLEAIDAYGLLTGNKYSDNQILFSFSYAYRFRFNLAIGGSIHLFLYNLAESTVLIPELDAGITYQPVHFITLTTTAKNAIPLSYSFNNLSPLGVYNKTGMNNIPIKFSAGIAFHLVQNTLNLTYNIEYTLFYDITHHGGIEYVIAKLFSIRIGMNNNMLTWGAGFNYKNIGINYSSGFSIFQTFYGLNHNFGVTVKFGTEYLIEKSMEYYYQGMTYYNKNDYLNAYKMFDQVLSIDPDHELAREYLKRAKVRLRSDEWMDKEAKELIRLHYAIAKKNIDNEEYGKALKEYSDILEINPEEEKAEEEIKRIRQLVSSRVDEIYAEAVIDFNREKYAEAMTKVNRALRYDFAHKPSLTLKTKIENILKEQKLKAQKFLEKKIEAAALYDEALKLFQKGEFAKAIDSLKRSNNLVPSDEAKDLLSKAEKALIEKESSTDKTKIAMKHFKIAQGYYKNRNYFAAQAEINQSLEQNPNYKEAEDLKILIQKDIETFINKPFEEGKNYYRDNDLANAMRKWKKVLSIAPDYPLVKEYIEKAQVHIKEAINLYMRRGDNAFSSGKYSEALKQYRNILVLDKNNSNANRAIEKCKKELASKIDMHFSKGKNLFDSKDYFGAVKEFDQVLQLDSEHVAAKKYKEMTVKEINKNKALLTINTMMNSGKELYANKNYKQALEKFEGILKIDNKNKEALKYRDLCNKGIEEKEAKQKVAKLFVEGIKEFQRHNFDKAVAKWTEVKSLDPENKLVDTYIEKAKKTKAEQENISFTKGMEFFKKEEYIAARKSFEDALKINPDYKEAKKQLDLVEDIIAEKKIKALSDGNKLYIAADYEGALKNYKMALSYDETDATIIEKIRDTEEIQKLYLDGVNYLDDNKISEAIDNFKEILTRNPQDIKTKSQLSKAYIKGKKLVDEWFEQGQDAFSDGDIKKAINRFEMVLAVQPEHIEAIDMLKRAKDEKRVVIVDNYNAGKRQLDRGNYKKAIEAFKIVVGLNRNYKDANSLLYSAQKKYDNKMKALKAQQDAAVYQYVYKGIELYRQGKYRDAISEWKKVLKVIPNDEKTIKYIKRAEYKLQQM